MDGNGVALIHIHPRCEKLISELLTYQYSPTAAQNGERVPLKMNDHGCFISGTLIDTDRGSIPIESVQIGDLVFTREGYRSVEVMQMTNAEAEVYQLLTVKGKELIGTGDHPIYCNGEWKPLAELKSGQNLYTDTVLAVYKFPHRQAVYNLTVADTHEYFANGILVHNCDAMRYMAWHLRNTQE